MDKQALSARRLAISLLIGRDIAVPYSPQTRVIGHALDREPVPPWCLHWSECVGINDVDQIALMKMGMRMTAEVTASWKAPSTVMVTEEVSSRGNTIREHRIVNGGVVAHFQEADWRFDDTDQGDAA